MKQVVSVLLVTFCSVLTVSESARLAHYNVNGKAISISGMSSGGFFAVQFHVAFSKNIMGAGIIAGGPFWCAEDSLLIANSSCVRSPDMISVSKLVSITYATALSLTIDNPSNMKDHKVFLFSGTKDTVVVPGVMKKLEEYYSHFVGGIETEFSIPAAHAVVTDSYGHSCGYLGTPYINNCGYPTAYHILQHIYGDIKKTNISNSGKPENLLEFGQSEFFANYPAAVSMDTTGFVYVPSDCRDGHKECRLHIAFHGCKQGRKYLSNVYALHTGYNGLAEENNIIVLYPQATNSTLPFNPKGCWDWWGYTAPSYASKLGPQMAGVKLMLNRVTHFNNNE